MTTSIELQVVDTVEAERVEGGTAKRFMYPTADDMVTQGFGLSNEQKAEHNLVNAVTIPM